MGGKSSTDLISVMVVVVSGSVSSSDVCRSTSHRTRASNWFVPGDSNGEILPGLVFNRARNSRAPIAQYVRPAAAAC